jgi:hypothetical protein
MAMYMSSNIQFPDELDGKLTFVKVGDKGQAVRCYTNCCKSQMTIVVAPKCVGFTTNFIKNEDGTPYEPPGPVANTMAKYSFDPSAVKEPKYSFLPFGAAMKLLYAFAVSPLDPFETTLKKQHPALFPDPAEAETVPITWES